MASSGSMSLGLAGKGGGYDVLRFAVAVVFVVGIMIFAQMAFGGNPDSAMLVFAAVIAGYMAMNIGANDVANNVGPAVGSQAMTMTGAILIAAIFEAGGALIAGGDVVGTIKKGIIDPALIDDTDTFVWLMTAALLAAAVWLNLATASGAPVSTTHSIVGGVLGAGIAAAGWQIADWDQMGAIAASWVISPLMGGLIAAAFLYLIKRTIVFQSDRLAAARRWVPLLIAVMAWAFSSYILLKGVKQLIKLDFAVALGLGLAAAVVIYLIVRPLIARASLRLDNDRGGINSLFTVPLIFSAALLSFAHGANDVANAVGPLAGIADAIAQGGVADKVGIPLWVMLIGALGIALGLALYGPKLIRTVGNEITELDRMRAFCVALAAAITVIVATQLGLPVSSTHIAVGGVFGVGFLREFLAANHQRVIEDIREHHQEDLDPAAVEEFLRQFDAASMDERGVMLRRLKATKKKLRPLRKSERKSLKKAYRQQLVKRSMLLKIAAAWVITVPVSALLAAMFYFMLRGMLLVV